jgi:ferric-dicitrate binding protein FerR (iron transport regulator)
MKENYLAKWLNNELSEEELAEFKRSEAFASYEKIIGASESLEAPTFDMERALHDFNKVRESSDKKVVRLHPSRYLMRIAAAITVLFAATYFYISSLDETFSTDYAQRTEVVLPDASEVFLNADSKLSYSARKWDEERNLSLEGEAFFKVAKGKKFTVATDAGTVSVLGTQFNVESRKGFFEVTCFEGLVSVNFQGTERKLPAGTSFMVINGTVLPAETLTASEPSWVRNESTFKSIPLLYVFDEFQRQYDIKVETNNIDLQQLFTGSFSNTNINLALQSISAPSQIQYSLEKNKVLFYAENAP